MYVPPAAGSSSQSPGRDDDRERLIAAPGLMQRWTESSPCLLARAQTASSLSPDQRSCSLMPRKPRTTGRRSSGGRPSGRRPAGRGRSRRAPQSHDAVCTECDSPTTVPFRPAPGRPVYCRSCFTNRPRGNRNGAQPLVEPVADHGQDAHSGAVFAGLELSRATRAAIARMAISEPTPIQEQSIPALLAGRDLVGQAQTDPERRWPSPCPLRKSAIRRPVAFRRWCWCRPGSWPSR